MKSVLPLLFIACSILNGCDDNNDESIVGNFQLTALRVGTVNILASESDLVPVDKSIVCSFAKPLDTTTVRNAISVFSKRHPSFDFSLSYLDDQKTISILPNASLEKNTTYTIAIKNSLKADDESIFLGLTKSFTTENPPLSVISAQIDGQEVGSDRISGISLNPSISVVFSDPIDVTDVVDNVSIVKPGVKIVPTISQSSENTLLFDFE
ncbi:MAG: Ig-like domain-containing protein, partial [Bacteroidota bacterium]